jgi:alginate O-acetyltransferase complex protein AlgI
MLFNSYSFILLVIFTFIIYYIPKLHRIQIGTLIIASLLFYSWHNINLLSLLLISVSINIVTSYYVVQRSTKNPKTIAFLGVISNLFILAFFKYAGLISLTFIKDNNISEFLINIPLPIGISFFTFQGISLVIDAYKDKSNEKESLVQNSLLQHAKNTLFFISFFPQLVAGPIVKAHEFIPQIERKFFIEIKWEKAFKEILLGYFFKMVIADNLKDFTYWIAHPYFQTQDSFSLITMLFGFSFQIFADFAGYSLIAIGISRLFGYNLNVNFNFPYISSSFQEFWKRWHISLSSFLQEYLYIPLGGNRKGKYRTYINLMITMILGGLWHGAAWSYAIWGSFHGIALATERILTRKKVKSKLYKNIKIMFVFTLVTFAWLLFKLPDFNNVIEYLKSISKNFYLKANINLISSIIIYSSPVIIYHLIHSYNTKKKSNVFTKYNYILYGLIIFLIITNSGTPGTFIYFQF